MDVSKIDSIINSLRDYAKQIRDSERTHHEECHTHHLKCLLLRASDQLSFLKKQVFEPSPESDTVRIMGWGKGKDE